MVLDLTERIFSHPSGETGRNIIIFGVGMSSSTKIENKKKYILILDKGPTQGLKHTLSAEKMYSINFSENYQTFCLSHYNGTSGYLLMIMKFIHLKQKILKLQQFDYVQETFQELMKQDIQNGTNVNVNVGQMQVFVIISNVGIMIKADVNLKN